MKTDCNPNKFRKYHERDETHLTSRSRVATPDCSIDLNRRVSGKGSFTDGIVRISLLSWLEFVNASWTPPNQMHL